MNGVHQVSDVDAACQVHYLGLTIDGQKLGEIERMQATGISSGKAGRERERIQKRDETAAAVYVARGCIRGADQRIKARNSSTIVAQVRKRESAAANGDRVGFHSRNGGQANQQRGQGQSSFGEQTHLRTPKSQVLTPALFPPKP